MLVSLELHAAVQCGHCEQPTPLPGLRLSLPCASCGQVIDVRRATAQGAMQGPVHFFGGHLDLYREATALMKEGGATRDDANQRFQMSWRKRRPYCGRCSAPVPEQALRETAGAVACACGNRIPARAADPEEHQWDRRIRWVVDGQHVAEHELRPTEQHGGIVHCGLCSAPLPAGRPGTIVRCGWCGQSNTLLERTYTGPGAAPPFFIVYSVDLFDIALAQRFFLRDERLGIDTPFGGGLLGCNSYRLTQPQREALAGDFAATLSALSHMNVEEASAAERLPDLPWDIAEVLLFRDELSPALVAAFLAREDLPKEERKRLKKLER
jgi:hypothetical protein